MDIGIDLGTTFSVVAVKGNVPLAASYASGADHTNDRPNYLPECDVTIIPTPEGELTYPSVLWWDPDDADRYIVGIDAKQKAADGLRPIMFSKRAIGTNEKLRMNGRDFTAREVAIQFLKYMKACAEQALGQPVDRAVVTHPAYFDRNQVQETLEAAHEAGFEMEPGQMMMEPAAAALAYTQNDARDPLRVLAYDLGGGTFDVTVLEKRSGVITMKAFDGNPRLGGYNFDRALVQWILGGLKQQGRAIPYDEDNEEDRGRYARLLQVAEGIKIRLAEQLTAKAQVPVKVDFLVDDQGRRTQFVGKISQETYTQIIKDELDETMECSRRALAKAGITAAEVDAVLLVGGSTYGPWVKRAVAAEFSVEVAPYNPDLCVAAGAAIEAAKLPTRTASKDLDLHVDARPTCALPTTNIPGQIRPAAGSRFDQAACRGLLVSLSLPAGSLAGPAPVAEDGKFIFQDVSLGEEGEASEYAVAVCDGPRELVRATFTITYQPEGGMETPINTVLPKPIYIKTGDGLVSVAEEGVTLPTTPCNIKLKRAFGGPVQIVPVFQEGEEIGTIRVEDIPESGGEGSYVLIAVELTRTNEMRGTAQVQTRTGTVVAQSNVRIAFPPIDIPEVPALHARFEELNDKREQAMLLSEDPAERLKLAGQGEKLVKKIRAKFLEQEPDRQEIHHALKDLEKMVTPPADDMEPPRTQMTGLIDSCREMISSKSDDPNIASFNPILQRIERDANDAHATKNRKKWGAAFESLRQLHSRIEKTVNPQEKDQKQELPPTPILKDKFSQDVDGLRSSLRSAEDKASKRLDYGTIYKPRCETLDKDLDTVTKGIERIPDGDAPEKALAQLRLVMRPIEGIKKRIRLINEGVDTEKG